MWNSDNLKLYQIVIFSSLEHQLKTIAEKPEEFFLTPATEACGAYECLSLRCIKDWVSQFARYSCVMFDEPYLQNDM